MYDFRSLWWAGVLCLFTLRSGSPPAAAQPAENASANRQQTPEDRQGRLAERDRLWQQSRELESEGKLDEALAAANKVLAIERDVFGPVHEEVAGTLERLGELHQAREDSAAAEKAFEEALQIRIRIYGERHWRVADNRWLLKDLQHAGQLDPQQRKLWEEAQQLTAQARQLEREGKYFDALPPAQKAVELHGVIWGQQHPRYAMALNSLGLLYHELEEYDKCEQLYRRARDIALAALGKDHPLSGTMLHNLARVYKAKGDYAKAESAYLEALAIDNEAYGEDDPHTATTLNALAVLYYQTAEYAKAEKLFLKTLHIRKQALGEDDPAYAINLGNLAVLYLATGDAARAEDCCLQALKIRERTLGKEHPDYANSLDTLANVCLHTGDYARAESLLLEALEIREKVFGRRHLAYVNSLSNLASLYSAMGDGAEALALQAKVVEHRREALGTDHPDYAQSLNNLAGYHMELGEHPRAELLFKRALEILKKSLGEKHPLYTDALHNLSGLYEKVGDFAHAADGRRRLLDIFKGLLGEEHPRCADCMSDLAWLFHAMGDDRQAESLLKTALAIQEKHVEKNPVSYAASLDNLARLHEDRGEYATAESLYRKSCAMLAESSGEQSLNYASSLSNVATVLSRMGRRAEARSSYERSLEITKKVVGEEHPKYATTLNNLADLYVALGLDAKAEPLLRRAVQIREKTLGKRHPEYGGILANLAALYHRTGDYARAENLLRQGLEVWRDHLELASTVQSERQQLAMLRAFRWMLDAYFSVGLLGGVPADQMYQHVLEWKGSVFARQRRMRIARSRPELAERFAELQSTASRLAKLALDGPKPKHRDVWERQVSELTEKKERQEAELARQTAKFAGEDLSPRCTPSDLRWRLPADAALVDLLEYTNTSFPSEGATGKTRKGHLLAFVVRSDRPVVQLDLGPSAAIREAIEAWRVANLPADLGRGPGTREKVRPPSPAPGKRPEQDDASPSQVLRRLLWEPLAPHLDGVRTVLVSPDGASARFPLAALPGRQVGTYLIEERRIAVVPIPQMLLEAPSVEKRRRLRPASLLLVGDVDFEASPAGTLLANRAAQGAEPSRPDGERWPVRRSAPGGPDRLRFETLPGAADEIEAVQTLWQAAHPDAPLQILCGVQPTEETFRREASGRTFVHLATHGFFAPAQLRSALDSSPGFPDEGTSPEAPRGDRVVSRDLTGWHPGLLSGLALAGANGGSDSAGSGDQVSDDGILTALEVSALDMRKTDLVVLSACETGLGREAGGEGLLGLQRAFQLAGAQTVVASLWKVEDEATRQLMTRFYENLWQKGMGKLEALHQAQLSVLNGTISASAARGPGQQERVRPEPGSARTSPHLWAAWVLSGDTGDLDLASKAE